MASLDAADRWTMSPSTPILLLGGGGHALVVAEAALLSGRTIAGFLDDDASPVLASAEFVRPPGTIGSRVRVSHLGRLDPDAPSDERFRGLSLVLALGNLELRDRILARWPSSALVAPAIIHPSAEVSPTASIAPGVFIGPRAIVHTLAHAHAHAILNSGCIVEHECLVGENSHIAPGAVLGGRVRLGRATLIGLGSRVLPNLRIGDRCVVGAGGVVIGDVPDATTLVGVPARRRA
jgi:UDP-perosamine 4-acetyltransferase